MKTVLVTGASGFVGQHVCADLLAHGFAVRALARSIPVRSADARIDWRRIDDIREIRNWSAYLENVNHVVHLAARVHVMRDRATDPIDAFREANVRATETLFAAAQSAGAERFVFLSSVKAMGERTEDRPFQASDTPCPIDPYGISKLEAEQLLLDVSEAGTTGVVILRPTLVYGAGVGGNFLRMLKLIDRGVPLPLGSIRNSRSLLAVQNLCCVIRASLTVRQPPHQPLLVADGQDVSTPNLVRLLARELQRPARLVRVPPAVLRIAGRLAGRSMEISRLCDSLQVDIGATCAALEWTPTISLEQGVRVVTNWYRNEVGR